MKSNKGATFFKEAATVTGSFSKIQLVGSGSGVHFDNIAFGILIEGSTAAVQTAAINDIGAIAITGSVVSACIEGPIMSFKLTEGEIIAYTL